MEEKKYKAFGQYQFDITGCEPVEKIFNILWKKATHFAVINAGVTAFQETGSSQKRKTFKKAFDEFPILKKRMIQAIWANVWTGTEAYNATLLVLGKAVNTDFNLFFNNVDSLFWSNGKSWDDLMLFHNNFLLFYVCTHEKFGSIFGNTQLFTELALPLPYRCLAHDKWRIQGVPIPNQLINKLIS